MTHPPSSSEQNPPTPLFADCIVNSCPLCGGSITTSGGRHSARCITAACRYEGEGVPNERESLVAFFKAHRPLPCGTDYPEKRAHWYACTCQKWASSKTISHIEVRHIEAFERHMADALIAGGWLCGTPVSRGDS